MNGRIIMRERLCHLSLGDSEFGNQPEETPRRSPRAGQVRQIMRFGKGDMLARPHKQSCA
jgi:hypothetical protein